MRLVSTSGSSVAVDFRSAVFQSTAADGGLVTPEVLPRLPNEAIAAMRGRDFPEIARALARHLLADELEARVLDEIVGNALDFPIPLVEVEPDLAQRLVGLVELAGGVDASDQRTDGAARYRLDFIAFFFEHPDDADVREAARAAGAEHRAYGRRRRAG